MWKIGLGVSMAALLAVGVAGCGVEITADTGFGCAIDDDCGGLGTCGDDGLCYDDAGTLITYGDYCTDFPDDPDCADYEAGLAGDDTSGDDTVECTDDSECADGETCDAGVCTAADDTSGDDTGGGASGDACTTDGDCDSGSCTDGVCD